MLEKPYKLYQSIKDAKRYMGRHKDYKRNEYPCIYCRGLGSYHKVEDRDCIEGYKLAPSYKCNACKGTGLGSKGSFMDEYNKQVEIYNREVKEYKSQLDKLKALKAKMDKDDFKIIALYGVTLL